MQKGSFDRDKKTGICKRYHPNGELYDQEEYNDDKKIGEWKNYDIKGKLIKSKKYKV
jgi:antitoxin component YwqK of YwqJK toxin-antitoxin module